jgi:hypothetical protein
MILFFYSLDKSSSNTEPKVGYRFEQLNLELETSWLVSTIVYLSI